jgi:hypothetical protein
MPLPHLVVVLTVRVVSHPRVAKADQIEEVQSMNSIPSEVGYLCQARTKGKQRCNVEGKESIQQR